MSILADRHTRVLVQGLTGLGGRLHAARCRAYAGGRKAFVAGVTPGKGGGRVDGLPVFDTVREARAATGATASLVVVPPAQAARAIEEAIDAGIELVVCITTGVPEGDMERVLARLEDSGTRLLGPNCPGLVVPGELSLGILPTAFHAGGRIGVMSRTGAQGPDVVARLAESGLGLSTVVGVGGDRLGGLGFVDVMQLFQRDPGTDAVLLIDEVDAVLALDGSAEHAFAAWLREHAHKPVAALLLGRGPAADRRAEAMQACGVRVAREPAAVGELLASLVEPECLPFD